MHSEQIDGSDLQSHYVVLVSSIPKCLVTLSRRLKEVLDTEIFR